jgi:hypothetical protein
VADPQGLVAVDLIKRLHARLDRILVTIKRLAAAGDAPTRAGHDLDEMDVLAPRPYRLKQLRRVLQAAGHGHADLDVANLG